MAEIDDYWKKIVENDKFKAMTPEKQKGARDFFFQKYIGSNPKFYKAPEQQRNAIRENFDSRITLPPEKDQSLLGTLKDTAKKVAGSDIVKDVAGAASGALKETAKVVADPTETVKAGTTPFPPAEKLQGAIREGTQKLQQFAEPSDQELVDAQQEKGAMGTAHRAVNTARMGESGAIGTGGEFLANFVPTTAADLSMWYGIGAIEKAAGTTFLGREIGKSAPWSSPKTANPTEALGMDLHASITSHLAQSNKPLEQIARAEQGSLYEKWLADHAENDPDVASLTPAAKVNLSQMRDFAQERLRKLQSEPVRVDSLANAEKTMWNIDPGETQKLLPEKASGKTKPTKGHIQLGPGEAPSTESPAIEPEAPKAPKKPAPRPITAKPRELKPDDMRVLHSIMEEEKNIEQDVAARLGEEIEGEMSPFARWVREHGGARASRGAGGKIAEGEEFQHGVPLHLRGHTQIDQLSAEAVSEGFRPEGYGSNEFMAEMAKEKAIQQPRSAKDIEFELRHRGDLGKWFQDHGYSRRKALEHIEKMTRAEPLNEAGYKNVMQILDDAKEAGYHDRLAKPAESLAPEANVELRGEKAGPVEPVDGVPGQSRIPGTDTKFPEGKIQAEDPKQIGQKPWKDMLGDIWELGDERGALNPAARDPAVKAKYDANVAELVRRCKAMGMETAEEMMAYAAAHGLNMADNNPFGAAAKSSVSLNAQPEWVGKEMKAVMDGVPEAQQALLQRAKSVERQAKRSGRKDSIAFANEKAGGENLHALQSYFFRHDNYGKMSDIEKQAMTFFRQDAIPDIGKIHTKNPHIKEILEMAKNPTEEMKRVLSNTAEHEENAFVDLRKYNDRQGHVENYLRGLWENPRGVADWLDHQGGMMSVFDKHKTFATYAAGMEAGFEPKTLDIGEIIKTTDAARAKLLFLNKMVDNLHESGALQPWYKDTKWIRVENDAFKRKVRVFNKVTNQYDEKMVQLAIDPHYKPLMQYLFADREHWNIPLGWGKTVDPLQLSGMYNALYKQTVLTLSAFHPLALTEQLLFGSKALQMPSNMARYIGGMARAVSEEYKFLPGPAKDLSPMDRMGFALSRAMKAFKQGDPVFQNRPLALDAAESLVTFNTMADVEHEMLAKVLGKVGDAITYAGKKIGGKTGEMAAKVSYIPSEAIKIQQKGTFTYMANQAKLIIYQRHLADSISEFGGKMPMKQIKQQTAIYTNKMFGGLALSAMLVSPKLMQFMHLSFFAPDWMGATWSRYAAIGSSGPQGRQARWEMARIMVYYATVWNSVNYVNSKRVLGKGRAMFDNEPGHEHEVVWGREKDPKTGAPGRIIYANPGRGMSDFFEFVHEPMKFIFSKHHDWEGAKAAVRGPAKYVGNRLAPTWHRMAELLTGHTVGGYPIQEGGLLSFEGSQHMPMTTAGRNVYGTLPTRKGMSYTKARDLLMSYERTGNREYLDEAKKWGVENRVNLLSAQAAAKRDYNRELLRMTPEKQKKTMASFRKTNEETR